MRTCNVIAIACSMLLAATGATADVIYLSQKSGSHEIPTPGGTMTTRGDVIRVDFTRSPTALTSAVKVLDGAVEFDKASENIDALHALSDTRFVLSTKDKATLGSLADFMPGDLVKCAIAAVVIVAVKRRYPHPTPAGHPPGPPRAAPPPGQEPAAVWQAAARRATSSKPRGGKTRLSGEGYKAYPPSGTELRQLSRSADPPAGEPPEGRQRGKRGARFSLLTLPLPRRLPASPP